MFSIGSLTTYKTADADTQALVDRRAGELAQWEIHWITPALIAALFVAGILGAMAHHVFYLKLDGQPAENQLKMIRYGTAMAFFVKSTLVGTVIMCYRQRIWHTFRKKAMTINAIDGLFSATEDPSQFFYNWEMIRNGKLATFMAACSWLIPLASVLSPASLTSDVRTSFNETTCDSVATLNFTHEALHNFRDETHFPGASLMFYNTTGNDTRAPGWFDYYDQPSKNAKRLATSSIYLGEAATNRNASIESCGIGWNCTYSLAFEGPGYKCDEASNDPSAPFKLNVFAPEGTFLYKASVDTGDYANPQIATGPKGIPLQSAPFPPLLGAFLHEPVLWVGYVVNTGKPYDPSSPYVKVWKTVHEPKIFKCVAYHTKYKFKMKFRGTVQNLTRESREFIRPLVETNFTLQGTNRTLVGPSENFIRPADKERYKLTASYHALNALIRNFLRGEISYEHPDNEAPYFLTKSDISETRLMEAKTSYAVSNLMDEIPEVYEDILVTLMSEPHLVVAQKLSVPCVKSRTVNVYVYHREGLWIGYAIAVGITFGFCIVGAWSIYQNGVASDTQFSRIMVTTRNPTIDRLSVGACLGGDPFPKELRETKLRFGVLLEEDPREGPLGQVEHCCFGTAGETKEIVKNGVYAGLKKYRRKEVEDGLLEEKEGLLDGNQEP